MPSTLIRGNNGASIHIIVTRAQKTRFLESRGPRAIAFQAMYSDDSTAGSEVSKILNFHDEASNWYNKL